MQKGGCSDPQKGAPSEVCNIYLCGTETFSCENLTRSTKRVAIATLFGALIFVTKALAPSPINKMLVVIQALLLALGSLFVGKMGATYVALIGGILTALWDLALAPFTIFFALLYGLFVDSFFFLFKVDIVEGRVKASRLIAAMTLSTLLAGISSYYTTAHLTGLVPRNLVTEIAIMIVGTVSGSVAGYLASIVWNRYSGKTEL